MDTSPADCLLRYFQPFRENIVGIDAQIQTPYGIKPMLYADWTASGRLYGPIEKKISEELGPYLANTHTDTSFTGRLMTEAYHWARQIVKDHVKAGDEYMLIQAGFGMTGAINKLQRILGLSVHERYRRLARESLERVPVVFVSRMEHHSNHISWLETVADTVLIPFDEQGLPDAGAYEELLRRNKDRPIYLAMTACSNVTGITPDIERFVRLTHKYGGHAFLDYACSAPYTDMDLSKGDASPDAITFSVHKFLGGPGGSGILIMKKSLYQNRIPDHPGGGTVVWTDPWDGAAYIDNPEVREDGGTPGYLQMIRAALAILLKEEMGTEKIHQREQELLDRLIPGLASIPGVTVLEERHRRRFGVVSILTGDLPYTLVTRLLNDLGGIQARGGCSCAGTYGHYLLGLDKARSEEWKNKVLKGETDIKPGWTRISVHPTTTDDEVEHILDTMEYIMKKGRNIADSDYVRKGAMFYHKDFDYDRSSRQILQSVFNV
ncbi:MAG: aminotransferase class V-fold PLP-dependent enzyme [Chlorobi bacterium]|nr:aminotransferase class V-fold PLP-dependent enzyme [Chlorobiota bacterium]